MKHLAITKQLLALKQSTQLTSQLSSQFIQTTGGWQAIRIISCMGIPMKHGNKSSWDGSGRSSIYEVMHHFAGPSRGEYFESHTWTRNTETTRETHGVFDRQQKVHGEPEVQLKTPRLFNKSHNSIIAINHRFSGWNHMFGTRKMELGWSGILLGVPAHVSALRTSNWSALPHPPGFPGGCET